MSFFSIWIAQAFSLLGSHLVQFALVWWLTQTTGSGTVLAGATIVSLLPQILFGPFAGALVDRWNRRLVMMVADGLIALATLLLAALFALDIAQIWHIYLLMFIRSIGGMFHWPAMQASTALMVPEQHLSRIAGMNQTLFGVTNIISPPLGALLLELLPMQGILGIDVGTALLAITPLFFVHIPQPERRAAPGTAAPTVLADLREGLRFVRGWTGLMLVLVISTLINLLVNPAMSLLPLMVTQHFKGGAPQLALLESGFGIGMVLGGIALSVWGGFRRRIVTGIVALILMGVGISLVGLTPANALPLAVAAFSLFGFMNPIVSGSIFATLQVTVPPDMHGRVFTLLMSASGAMSPLGLAIAGPLADVLSARVWFLVGGLVTALLGVGCFFVPAITQLEEGARPAAAAQPAEAPAPGIGPEIAP